MLGELVHCGSNWVPDKNVSTLRIYVCQFCGHHSLEEEAATTFHRRETKAVHARSAVEGRRVRMEVRISTGMSFQSTRSGSGLACSTSHVFLPNLHSTVPPHVFFLQNINPILPVHHCCQHKSNPYLTLQSSIVRPFSLSPATIQAPSPKQPHQPPELIKQPPFNFPNHYHAVVS